MAMSRLVVFVIFISHINTTNSFFTFGSSGNEFPRLYEGWFDGQLAKQASSAVAKAYAAGIRKMEVQFPAVPNLEEVRFGTTLNQKFGKDIVAADLKIEGGYRPGSEVSRQLVLFSNIYWAKRIANSINSEAIACLTTEPLTFGSIKSLGKISRIAAATNIARSQRDQERKKECVIFINPGGEEQWDRFFASLTSPMSSMIVLNNLFSTSYDLGNTRGYEEAFFLKRISKGWVYRVYPGPWEAYLEKPDGSLEKLQSYQTKPQLRDVSELVRNESFKRYSIYNDRWSQGFGGRL